MSFTVDTSLSVPPRPNDLPTQLPSSNTSIPIINKGYQSHISVLSMDTHDPRLGGPSRNTINNPLRRTRRSKTVNFYSSLMLMRENRIWQQDYRNRPFIQPNKLYTPQLLPPQCYVDNSASSITTALVKTVSNKIQCPVFCVVWTPNGKRLISGSSSGEFTLWNGLTFNFETIFKAHNSPVRSMVWSHNDNWMITGEHNGFIKYWQSNMNSVAMFKAHNGAIRGISFSPSDEKFATCSDDGTIIIWDFLTKKNERRLIGHEADVKCIDWNPFKSLLISGSKDIQHPIKLWDPRTGKSLATLHAHKSTVMDVKWNANCNWLLSTSRDHLIKLFDIRKLSHEVQTFRGHKKEVSSIAWHPFHENLFCSGDSNGAIFFWNVDIDKSIKSVVQAHDSIIWALSWNPLGDVLCSGSNDSTCKFWTRHKPGDNIISKYDSFNIVPTTLKKEYKNDSFQSIPEMCSIINTDSYKSLFNKCNTIPFLEDISTTTSSTVENIIKVQSVQ